MRWPRREHVLLLCLLTALVGLAASRVDSFDIFWQLQSGRYMAQTGEILRADLFSLATDAPRIEHCWLHDLICYGLYLFGGFGALSLLKGVLVGGTGFFVCAAARLRGASVLSLCLLAVPAFALTAWAWIDRPQLWSFCLFALFLWLLQRHARVGDRLVLLMVPLFVLWGNLHAGAVLAFPLLGAFIAGETLGKCAATPPIPRRGYRLLWWTLVGVILVSFINPYGSFLWRMLLQVPGLGSDSGALEQTYNMDWKLTSLGANWDFYLAVILAAALMLAGRRATRLSDWVLMAGLVLVGARLERHTPFFLFAFATVAPACFDACRRRIRTRALGKVLVVAAGLLVLVSFRDIYLRHGFFDTGLQNMKYPLQASAFVARERPPGNLFNAYEWGGYLMWRLYPDYLVFWDGRQDSREYFRRGLHILYGEPGWQEELDRDEVNTLVLKPLSVDVGGRFLLLDRLRQSPVWALVHAGANDLVFVRKNSMSAGWLAVRTLPMERIDDVILSEAVFLLSEHGKNRYRSWWEIFRIRFSRQQYPEALTALEAFKKAAPRQEAEAKIVIDYLTLLRSKTGGQP